jgi:omega-6 fatty acid desaturase (delta-12 desaturase)
MQSIPTRKQIQKELAVYIKPNTTHGVVLFVADILMYILAIVLVLASSSWILKLIGGIIAGIKMANLSTLAHDAAHNSLTKSRKINKYIAIVGFTPGLFNYALWLHDHHFLHHRRTNQDHPDSYVPLSRQEYDALSAFGRFKYRLYRAPSIWIFGLYYIVERWWKAKFFPRKHMPVHVQRDAWFQFAYLVTYLASFLALLIMAPLYSPSSTLEALMYGFVLPFYVYQTLYSFTVFVQHNHCRVPWFKDKRPRDGDGQQACITVQLVFPKWFSTAVHNVYDHAAHHVHPAIPSYQLPAAQEKLNELLGDRAVVSRFSFSWLYGFMRRCKLYDYERHYWTNFEDEATTRVTLASHQDHTEIKYAKTDRRRSIGFATW